MATDSTIMRPMFVAKTPHALDPNSLVSRFASALDVTPVCCSAIAHAPPSSSMSLTSLCCFSLLLFPLPCIPPPQFSDLTARRTC